MVISKKKREEEHLVVRPRWTEFTIGCRLWWRPLEDDSILGLPIPGQLFPNPPLCKYDVTSFESRELLLASLWSDALGVTVYRITHPSHPSHPQIALSVTIHPIQSITQSVQSVQSCDATFILDDIITIKGKSEDSIAKRSDSFAFTCIAGIEYRSLISRHKWNEIGICILASLLQLGNCGNWHEEGTLLTLATR